MAFNWVNGRFIYFLILKSGSLLKLILIVDDSNTILTVSQLNLQVKNFLEYELGKIHVEGEISNLSKPSSGHWYFTLKDSRAQIRCAFFKNRHDRLNPPVFSEGQHVIAKGCLSLYEARGDYQLIVEELTDAGLGILYQKFEELKKKLSAEGLFAVERKKSLPEFPKQIGIITSPTGAALQDILSTLARRYPVAKITIYSSEVQGARAAHLLVNALQQANQDAFCEVIILARGGGSLEDLWPFNEEILAREIANSKIPVITGIGHETDFTIADFVADYRAETPTAAASAATPNRLDLLTQIKLLEQRLLASMVRLLQYQQIQLSHLMEKIASPHRTISVYWQNLDYLERQLILLTFQNISAKRNQLQLLQQKINTLNPRTVIREQHNRIQHLQLQLLQILKYRIQKSKMLFSSLASTLNAVSPLATLERGYAIVTTLNKEVIYTYKQVKPGEFLQLKLAEGQLDCEVIQSTSEPQ